MGSYARGMLHQQMRLSACSEMAFFAANKRSMHGSAHKKTRLCGLFLWARKIRRAIS
jgi:hypothetical protein